MKFETTVDIENYFKVLQDNNLEIPGVYSPAELVIDNKINNMVHAGNKDNLEINVGKVIKAIELKKMKSFNEMETAISDYFAQYNVSDKLEQVYQKISLAGTKIDGVKLEEAKKEFKQSTKFMWGMIVDFRKSLKINLGKIEYYSFSGSYNIYGGSDNITALNYLVKHFFDVDLPSMMNMTTWRDADISKWIDYGNGLQGKMYKNGTFEIKHKDLDILTKELHHYYRSKYDHYFIQI
jgi:hypothetical protein